MNSEFYENYIKLFIIFQNYSLVSEVIGISRAPFLNGMQAIVTESLGESRWAVRSVDPDPQRGRMFLDSVHAESGFSTENLIKIHRDFSQMKWKQ